MTDNEDMGSILNIFAEKMLLNLVYSTQPEENSTRLINSTLEIFSFYTGSVTSCRLIGESPIMKNLI